MAAPTGTLQTYQAIGNREDLSDVITRISPTDTPFMSGIGKTKAENTLHEWQTQALATAAANAAVEGDDAVAAAATPTVRLSNRTQISTKIISVSGTQMKGMNPAGRKNELAYQMALKSAELKRDIEFGLTQNTTLVAGSATVARQSRGLEGWIATNNDMGTSGVAPIISSNTAPVDGTPRAFTETMLKNVLQLAFVQGGKPDTIMVGSSNKQTFSGFTGGATKFDKTEDKTLTAAIDVYVSDFGTLKVIPNLFQRSRTAFVLEMDKWKMAMLRPYETNELAKTGDSEKRQILVEYCLEALAENASGAVRDLT
jgi:hypothetical protein